MDKTHLRDRNIADKNNNPGNITDTSTPWQGLVGSNAGSVEFSTPEHGVRAVAKNLYTSQETHGTNTVTDIITRWAPPSENDTQAYINKVAADLEVDPNDDLGSLKDNPELTRKLIKSIAEQEGATTGPDGKFTDEVIMNGVAMANGKPAEEVNFAKQDTDHKAELYSSGLDGLPTKEEAQMDSGLDFLNDYKPPVAKIRPKRKPVPAIQQFIASMNKSSGFARPTKYEVVFHLPEMLMGKYDTRQLTMHCDTIGWPGHDLQTQGVKKASEPAKHYVQAHAFKGNISATFYLDVQHSERFLFEQWQELAVNRYTHKANYYKDYIGSMEMYQLSSELNKIDFANNKRFSKRGDLIGDINNSVEGEGIRTYGIKVFDVFPETISPTEYAYISAETVQLLTVEFNYREHLPITINDDNKRPII